MLNSSSPMAASTSVSKSRTLPPQTLLECTWPGFNNGIIIGKDWYNYIEFPIIDSIAIIK